MSYSLNIYLYKNQITVEKYYYFLEWKIKIPILIFYY